MQIYGYLRPELRGEVPDQGQAFPLGEWPLPVWMPSLPAEASSEHSLLRALAAVPESERRPYLFAFLALASALFFRPDWKGGLFRMLLASWLAVYVLVFIV